MKNFRVKSLVTLLSVAALSGCAATRDAAKNYGDNLKISQNSVQGAEPRSSVSVADPSQDRMSNFGRVQRNWVNPVPLPRTTVDAERSRLPAVFQKQVSFTMPGRVTLVEVLSELQRANSIKVNINQDIYDSTVGEAVIVGAGNRTNKNTVAPVTVNDFVFRGSL